MAGGIRSSGGGRKPTLPTGQKSKLTRIAPPAELMGEAAIRMWKTQSKILIDRGVLTTGSDVRLKDAFMEPQEGASRRINSLGVCEFNMKGETRRRRGFIAQQAEKVDDLYTFLGIEQESDGEKFRVMNVDYTAILADLVLTVQELRQQVNDLMK
ncbi:tail fiber domain-containing protein [Klebsiella variicola]|uniref:tail fiber domain-containing protein n=1 Tax=Klebsiella variicola TaxID=244366 RepID=UPI002180FFE5|nr:tail fiber domain-containing protein [Klebsiella variicola]MDM7054373.1 tail fiber domain-containing protein [Klebsiella variicola]GKL80815.1 hypothetical protein NUKP62_39020 [Klebsiella variicola]